MGPLTIARRVLSLRMDERPAIQSEHT